MTKTNMNIYGKLEQLLLEKVTEELCLRFIAIDPQLEKLSKQLSDKELEKIIGKVINDVKKYNARN